jgi:hypothetical protein
VHYVIGSLALEGCLPGCRRRFPRRTGKRFGWFGGPPTRKSLCQATRKMEMGLRLGARWGSRREEQPTATDHCAKPHGFLSRNLKFRDPYFPIIKDTEETQKSRHRRHTFPPSTTYSPFPARFLPPRHLPRKQHFQEPWSHFDLINVDFPDR